MWLGFLICFLWPSCQKSKTPNQSAAKFSSYVNAGLDSVAKLRGEEQYEEAFKYLIQLIEPAKHLDQDDCTRARFHWEMGDILRTSGSFIPALHHLKLANRTDLSSCDLENLGHTQSETFGTIGSVYLLTSLEWNKDSALHYFRKANEIALGYDDNTDRASALNNLGIAYMNLDEDIRAKQLFESSLELVVYRSQRDTDLVVSILDNHGLIALKEHQYSEALNFFQQKEGLFVEQAHDRFYDRSRIRNLLQMASIALTKMGNDSLAMAYINILETSDAYSVAPMIEHQMEVLENKETVFKKDRKSPRCGSVC